MSWQRRLARLIRLATLVRIRRRRVYLTWSFGRVARLATVSYLISLHWSSTDFSPSVGDIRHLQGTFTIANSLLSPVYQCFIDARLPQYVPPFWRIRFDRDQTSNDSLPCGICVQNPLPVMMRRLVESVCRSLQRLHSILWTNLDSFAKAIFQSSDVYQFSNLKRCIWNISFHLSCSLDSFSPYVYTVCSI